LTGWWQITAAAQDGVQRRGDLGAEVTELPADTFQWQISGWQQCLGIEGGGEYNLIGRQDAVSGIQFPVRSRALQMRNPLLLHPDTRVLQQGTAQIGRTDPASLGKEQATGTLRTAGTGAGLLLREMVYQILRQWMAVHEFLLALGFF